MLEIVGDESEMGGLGDVGRGEAVALVALGRGMVELENLEPVARLETVGEGVEPGSEHEDLPGAGFDRGLGAVLGEAAAHGDEKAEAAPSRLGFRDGDRLLGVAAENADGERVGENEAALERLMRRSVAGRAQSRAAGLSMFHGAENYGRLARLSRRNIFS